MEVVGEVVGAAWPASAASTMHHWTCIIDTHLVQFFILIFRFDFSFFKLNFSWQTWLVKQIKFVLLKLNASTPTKRPEAFYTNRVIQLSLIHI